jgi:cbb3-type cytochrome oxidase subunit 3
VSFAISFSLTIAFTLICVAIIAWIFKTGYGLRI